MMSRRPEATSEARAAESVKNGQNEEKEEREWAECQKKSVDQRKCWRGSEVQDLHLTLCATYRVCYTACATICYIPCVLRTMCATPHVLQRRRWCVVSIVLPVVCLNSGSVFTTCTCVSVLCGWL
ncbi:hypothetical protein EYF80_014458 [Liparis tanakae]|uniref:Uncharacterized protein n=1 Tax=Liparis tanakae TaxID=230148 RepID=A0A4Z2ICF5_9TELE|nr:hypothetical protein EYF80_014458 [Liparis tanakae]